LLIELNPAYVAGAPQKPRGSWNLKLQQSDDHPDLWRVALDLAFEPDTEHPGPYRIALTMIGFFRLPDGLERPEAARLVGITGASILYSAAREQVLLVTGRGVWGPFQLPTIRFPPPDLPGGERIAGPEKREERLHPPRGRRQSPALRKRAGQPRRSK